VATADGLLLLLHEQLVARLPGCALADLASLGGLPNGFDCLVDLGGRHGNLDLDLWHTLDFVLGAAIDLGVTLLAPEAFDFGHCHALRTKLTESGSHSLELERLDNCCDESHVASSVRDCAGSLSAYLR
jgi:hypothetical protein